MIPVLARLRRADHGRACPFIGVKRSWRLPARNEAIEPTRTSRPSANTQLTTEQTCPITRFGRQYVRRPLGPNAEPHAFKSVIRMIATTRPSLAECSFVSLLQVQTKSFLAVKVLPSCTT